MKKQSFHNMLEHPQLLEEKDFLHLKEITNHFPFFTTARILQLKAMKLIEHFDYAAALKSTSIYAHDRNKLFELIHQDERKIALSPSFKPEVVNTTSTISIENKLPVVEQEAINDEEIENENLSVESGSPDFIQQLIEQQPDEVDLQDVAEKEIPLEFTIAKTKQSISNEKEIIIDGEMVEEEIIEDQKIIIGTQTTDSIEIQVEIPDNAKAKIVAETEVSEPVVNSAKETKSFTDWLKIIGKKNEQESIAKESTATKKILSTDQKGIIDSFLETQPRIEVKKAEFYSPVNMARKSLILDDEIISETLAEIFIKQGLFDKAINAYEKLTLKFPEKKVFFAARIENIIALKKSHK